MISTSSNKIDEIVAPDEIETYVSMPSCLLQGCSNDLIIFRADGGNHFTHYGIPMYCSNCGALLYGYRNDEGKIKYECKRCGTVAVRVQKGRRHDKIDLYAPEGQVRYY